MGILMIRCTRTGRPVSTGVETDAESLARAPDYIAYLLCPECGRYHPWRPKDAWLEEWSGVGQPDISRVGDDGDVGKRV
jgi:hypothetical protein